LSAAKPGLRLLPVTGGTDFMPNICIFCGRAGLSKEHVWPGWSHSYIRKAKHGARRHRRAARIRGKDKSIEREGDVTKIQLRVVCEKHCNNGWMSRLETRVMPIVIPLLTGAPIQLNKYNQEILATWIAMKLQIFEFNFPDKSIVTPALERSLLMGRRVPPDIMSIWIARYRGVQENSYYREAGGVAWRNR